MLLACQPTSIWQLTPCRALRSSSSTATPSRRSSGSRRSGSSIGPIRSSCPHPASASPFPAASTRRRRRTEIGSRPSWSCSALRSTWWGTTGAGIHVAALAMSRPDLIRSWASDALGVFAPDYDWHPRAQVWQQEGPGEASVRELWGGDLEQRLAVAAALGMTGRMAERVAAGMDPEMGTAVLKLLRSARQPAMAEAGRLLPNAAERPGLALIAVDDFERASGTLAQHEWAAQQSGATDGPSGGRGPLVAGTDPGAGGRGADELLGRTAGCGKGSGDRLPAVTSGCAPRPEPRKPRRKRGFRIARPRGFEPLPSVP